MRTLVLVALVFVAVSARCAASEREITFRGGDGVPLAGTLVAPEKARPAAGFPAVVLLQGSGPTDRDGNQWPMIVTDLLRQASDVLAAEGIASLRYDKRGMHENHATLPSRPDELPGFFAWSAFLEDARSAVRFLGDQPGIDGQRVGVVGHSEGGLFALSLAASDDVPLKVIVIASTPARPLGEIIHEQIARALEMQQATAAQRKFFLDADLRIQARIRETGSVPPDVPAGIAAFYPPYAGPYLKSALELNPAAIAARLRIPMLAIYGDADTQVSAERDAPLMASVLSGKNDGTRVTVVPNVSHNLKTVTTTGNPGFAGPLDESVKRELVTWLRDAL